MESVKIKLTGDTSLLVEFGNEISYEINAKVRAFNILLKKNNIAGIVETVPTYRSVTIHYKPEIIRYKELAERLEVIIASIDDVEFEPAVVVEVPVLYGGDEGPDLEYVAKYNNKTPHEVIEIHSSTEYLIYMLGFTPGFTYLGGMSKEIATPRKQTPRVKIPAGSVGIAGEQTGAYPIDSPGGWQLIGQTPVKLYDPNRENPILLEAGQYVKFVPIDRETFVRIKEQAENGTYECNVYSKED